MLGIVDFCGVVWDRHQVGLAESDAGAPLAEQRYAAILAELATRGGVRISELTAQLGVSDMTIRRDIGTLADRGLLRRVHGGAVPPSSAAEEPDFATKATLSQAAKAAIGRAAAQLVSPGQAVAVSSGTTTLDVARCLLDVPDLTIVTNSIPVADLMSRYHSTQRSLIVTGGERTPSAALVGPIADAALDKLHVDWLFLGVHGLDAEIGLTAPNAQEATTSRALLDCATRRVVVADSSKWSIRGHWTIAPLAQLDIVVTDTDLDPDLAAATRVHVPDLRKVTP